MNSQSIRGNVGTMEKNALLASLIKCELELRRFEAHFAQQANENSFICFLALTHVQIAMKQIHQIKE